MKLLYFAMPLRMANPNDSFLGRVRECDRIVRIFEQTPSSQRATSQCQNDLHDTYLLSKGEYIWGNKEGVGCQPRDLFYIDIELSGLYCRELKKFSGPVQCAANPSPIATKLYRCPAKPSNPTSHLPVSHQLGIRHSYWELLVSQ